MEKLRYILSEAPMKPIIPPRLVVEPIRQINSALLGTKAERDAFADEMIRREDEYQQAMAGLPATPPLSDTKLRRLADADSEKHREGRSWPTRHNRDND
jgi:hypothetical protein